jgi:hypothetical protein
MLATVDPSALFSLTVMVVGEDSTGGSFASLMLTRTCTTHHGGRN